MYQEVANSLVSKSGTKINRSLAIIHVIEAVKPHNLRYFLDQLGLSSKLCSLSFLTSHHLSHNCKTKITKCTNNFRYRASSESSYF